MPRFKSVYSSTLFLRRKLMEGKFKIAVIGLGVIGGSLAYALRGFKDCEISGYDLNEDVVKLARERGAIDYGCHSSKEAVKNADLIIICVYPEYIHKIIEDCRDELKKGAVITDVCGVKTGISKRIEAVLPNGVFYVGGHPMAGREVDGFINAEKDLFVDSGYIITPVDTSDDKSIRLVYDMAKYIGASRITVNTPSKHDEIIAYTSDLMHIAASALCLTYNEDMNRAYTAGSFRDCTRSALINPELWAELFLSNKKNTLFEIDRFLDNINELRTAIDNDDFDKLYSLLSKVRENKIKMQNSEPEEIKLNDKSLK